MDTFVEKHLNKCKVNFWDPLPNLKIKTFSSTTKTTHVYQSQKTSLSRSALTEISLEASNARQIASRKYLAMNCRQYRFLLYMRMVASGKPQTCICYNPRRPNACFSSPFPIHSTKSGLHQRRNGYGTDDEV